MVNFLPFFSQTGRLAHAPETPEVKTFSLLFNEIPSFLHCTFFLNQCLLKSLFFLTGKEVTGGEGGGEVGTDGRWGEC